MNKGISETDFGSQVEDLFKVFGWRWTHFRPARTQKGWRTPLTGDKGLPDYIAIRPPRLIFAELKDEHSKPSPEQWSWLEDLRECVRQITYTPIELGKRQVANLAPSFEVYLWRPSQIDEITEILK